MSLEFGLFRAAFLSEGQVVSSLGAFYCSAELPHWVLSPVAVAKVTCLRRGTHIMFMELCGRGLFGRWVCDAQNNIEGEVLNTRPFVHHDIRKGRLSIVIHHTLKHSTVSNSCVCIENMSPPEVSTKEMCLLIHSPTVFVCLFCTRHSARPWGFRRGLTDRQKSVLTEPAFACMNGNHYYFELFVMFWQSIEMDNIVSLLRKIKN